MARVAGADVGEKLPRAWPERGECVEEPVLAARLEAALQFDMQLRIAGPELVELLDRRHQPPDGGWCRLSAKRTSGGGSGEPGGSPGGEPPAIAGRRITVEPSGTGVSSPSRVR